VSLLPLSRKDPRSTWTPEIFYIWTFSPSPDLETLLLEDPEVSAEEDLEVAAVEASAEAVAVSAVAEAVASVAAVVVAVEASAVVEAEEDSKCTFKAFD